MQVNTRTRLITLKGFNLTLTISLDRVRPQRLEERPIEGNKKNSVNKVVRWGVQIYIKFMNLSEHKALSSAELKQISP